MLISSAGVREDGSTHQTHATRYLIKKLPAVYQRNIEEILAKMDNVQMWSNVNLADRQGPAGVLHRDPTQVCFFICLVVVLLCLLIFE